LTGLDFRSYKTVVVDNSPETDGAASVAAKYGAEYRAAPMPGLSRARNVGVRHQESDIIAFVDDNKVVHPRWLSALVEEFENKRSVVVTGPVLPIELAEMPDSVLSANISRWPWGSEPFTVDRNSSDWFERANFGGVGDGNFALRSSVLASWPGFDERLGRSAAIDVGEEHYAFFQIIEQGNAVTYTPNAIVFRPNLLRSHSQSLTNLAHHFAYAGFLMLEHPRYVLGTCKFLAQGLIGTQRNWKNWDNERPSRRVSPRELFRALRKSTSLLRRTYWGR
jgi:glycosyltransferase involved in cell wall biosynthesis